MEFLIFDTKSKKYKHNPDAYKGLRDYIYDAAISRLASIVRSTVIDVDVAAVAIPATIGNNGTISGSDKYALWVGNNNLQDDLMFRLNANSLVRKVILKNRATVRIGGASALNGILSFAQVAVSSR